MKEALLKKRLGETPQMEITDAVKLVYQSEFGCGHLLAPQEECAQRIQEEMGRTQAMDGIPAWVDIGDDLCRLELRAPAVRALPALLVARMMAWSAANVHGSLPGFRGKLDVLRGLCAQAELPFDPQALDAYLESYARQGFPPVSHSATYRAAYAPAYRVVSRVYGWALPVITGVQRRLEAEGRALVVVDGVCGAGKTTLAAALAPLWEAPVIPMDHFFLPQDMRTQERLATPGGNVHHERFSAEVLAALLGEAAPFTYQRYQCRTGESLPQAVPPAPVLFIEGSYSHHPAFQEAYQRLNALRVLLTVSQEEQLRRLAARDPAQLPRFQAEWIPLENAYFQAYHREKHAEIILRAQEGEP